MNDAPYVVHVEPHGSPEDQEHEAGLDLTQSHPSQSCPLCQQGICHQYVEQVARYDGGVGLVVVHGTVTQ